MNNPYTVLGIKVGASQAEVKKTYHTLARRHHPDSHQNDSRAEERFKEIAAAYALLSDPQKRAAFDNGDIDASGQPIRTRSQASSGWRNAAHAYAQRGGATAAGGAWAAQRHGGKGRFDAFFKNRADTFKTKGANVSYTLTSDFIEAAKGGVRHIKIANGKHLKVSIPPGTENGQILRLKGQGTAGMGGGENGDAHVEIRVLDDPVFTRKGFDVHITVPLSLPEAILGAKVDVPTIDGPVSLGIPAGSNSGTKLRLKGKGISKGKNQPRGDQYVSVSVALPQKPDPELTKFIEKWAAKHAYNPRTHTK